MLREAWTSWRSLPVLLLLLVAEAVEDCDVSDGLWESNTTKVTPLWWVSPPMSTVTETDASFCLPSCLAYSDDIELDPGLIVLQFNHLGIGGQSTCLVGSEP